MLPNEKIISLQSAHSVHEEVAPYNVETPPMQQQEKQTRFIKLIPSEETSWLMANYPHAFLLLTLIAQRARRTIGHPDGLQIGDALIGDPDSAGLSRQQYRTAIKKLVEFQHIEIQYNGKKFLKRQKSTIKSTIKGMIVSLISSTIYDINPEDTNQHINQRSTNSQPTANHKQECIKKEKKEKEENIQVSASPQPSHVPEKKSSLEFKEKAPHVKVSDQEHSELIKDFGEDLTEKAYIRLSEWKEDTPKSKWKKSDYRTIRRWVIDAIKEKEAKASKISIPQSPRTNMNKEHLEEYKKTEGSFNDNANIKRF